MGHLQRFRRLGLVFVVLIPLLLLLSVIPSSKRLALQALKSRDNRSTQGLTQEQIENLRHRKIAHVTINAEGRVSLPEGFPDRYDALFFKGASYRGGYCIFWQDPGSDGRMSLTFFPNLAMLRTGHDNPNPNCLEWCGPLTSSQYNTAKLFFESQKIPARFYSRFGNDLSELYLESPYSFRLPGDVDSSEWARILEGHIYGHNCNQYTYHNTKFVLDDINAFTKDPTGRIPTPSLTEIADFHSLLLPYSLAELADTPRWERKKNKSGPSLKRVRWHYPLTSPITFMVENNGDRPSTMTVKIEKIDLKGRVIAKLPIQKASVLAPGSTSALVWDVSKAPQGFIRPGATLARVKAHYTDALNSSGNDEASDSFFLGYAKSPSQILAIQDPRYLLQELYYLTREKQLKSDPKAFSVPEKTLTDVWRFLSTGLHWGFFCEYGQDLVDIQRSLRRIGAINNASVIGEALGLLGKKPLPRNDEEWCALSKSWSKDEEDRLSDIQSKDDELKEDKMLLLHRYVMAHQADFLD